jgi:hypothetical protein
MQVSKSSLQWKRQSSEEIKKIVQMERTTTFLDQQNYYWEMAILLKVICKFSAIPPDFNHIVTGVVKQS